MSNPKVLHLATSLGGGAGIATRRIVQAQIDHGMDSHLSSANQSGAVLTPHESILPRTTITKYRSKALTFLQTNFLQNSDFLVTPFSSNTFRNWQSEVAGAEVIHLHAFYNLISIEVLTKLSEMAPLVITMHDQRFFTGGCHYSGDCSGFKFQCQKCPQMRKPFNRFANISLMSSIQATRSLSRVKFISPSGWLASLAQESVVLSGNSISVISNPVPTLFCPEVDIRPKTRNRLSVGFISEDLHNPYKGIQILVDALDKLPQDIEFEVKLVGKGPIPRLKSGHLITASYLKNPEDIARIIKSCDVIVVPSLQDNSPSVISESLMCGTPIIGSKVGGITEILQEFKLPGFEKGNSDELSRILASFNPIKFSATVFKNINEKFSNFTSASKHLEIYREMLA